GFDEGGSGDDLYDRAVAVVTRDKKASTSYVQRRLQIGYNRAASLIERMENEGVVSPANHAGKREVLVGPPP
ncbi:DNA translocase FtsK, partial [Phenylobacterium sp.]